MKRDKVVVEINLVESGLDNFIKKLIFEKERLKKEGWKNLVIKQHGMEGAWLEILGNRSEVKKNKKSNNFNGGEE